MVNASSVGRPAGVRAAFFVLATIMVASAGVFFLLQRWPDTGAALATPTAPVVITVPEGELRTQAPVTVTVSATLPAPLIAPMLSGVVTAVRLSSDDALRQGDVVFDIDGRPVRAAATAEPFYRVIVPDDTGKDVAALRALLVDVGVEVAASGPADKALRDAVSTWLGRQPEGVVFDPADVIWLPTTGLVVGAVAATVGAPAPAAGSPVVTFAPVVTSATVPLNTLATGATGFTVAVAGRSVPVDESGTLRLSDDDARAIAATSRAISPNVLGDTIADSGMNGDMPGTLTTTWASPVVTIPTSALIALQDGTLCAVTVDGAADRAVSVTVVASRTDTGTSQVLGLEAGASLVVNPVASTRVSACDA